MQHKMHYFLVKQNLMSHSKDITRRCFQLKITDIETSNQTTQPSVIMLLMREVQTKISILEKTLISLNL